jgi:aspartate/methionine/tyrosine aminotransferase
MMKLEPFNLERIQSEWEHQVEFNLSESGVEPLRIAELLDTPELREQFLNTQLGYSQTNGTIPLRQAIVNYYPGTGVDNVVVTNGGAEANYLVTWRFFHEYPSRREFIVMIPNYMQMSGIWKALGGNVKTFKLKMKQDRWIPDIEGLKAQVTKKTIAVAICNPNNPTGAIIGDSELDAIVDIASEKDAWIISDEIYRGAEMQDMKAPTMHGRYDKTIITSSLSKAYGLPGLRLGWAVCPTQQVAKELWTYSDYTSICPSKMSDWLATLALKPSVQARIEERTRKVVRDNWLIIRKWIDSHSDLLECIAPSAAAICFAKQKTAMSSLELVMRLLNEKSVLISPGEYFEMPGFIRIGFGSKKEYLEQALKRISEMLNSL